MGKKEINLGFHFQFLSVGKPRNGNKLVAEKNLGKKEINLGFHFQFLSMEKPRNGNKKVNSPGFFFCFAFRFLRNQTVGDCEAFLWPRVVLCFAWVVGRR